MPPLCLMIMISIWDSSQHHERSRLSCWKFHLHRSFSRREKQRKYYVNVCKRFVVTVCGQYRDDDMISLASMMSISNLSTIGFLEDEDEEYYWLVYMQLLPIINIRIHQYVIQTDSWLYKLNKLQVNVPIGINTCTCTWTPVWQSVPMLSLLHTCLSIEMGTWNDKVDKHPATLYCQYHVCLFPLIYYTFVQCTLCIHVHVHVKCTQRVFGSSCWKTILC